MPAVVVSDLVVRRGNRAVVDGVSFAVELGEVVCVLGPNGAGKTTTLETVEGYLRPASGSVRVLERDPLADGAVLAGEIGVLLQEEGLYPAMSPSRALHLFASYYERPRSPTELLALVGLAAVADVRAKRLSGGERRRLALALALVGRPRVVFLDEPTSGVDPEGRVAIRSVIEGLRAEGCAVVVTTHELDEAERVSDRLVLLQQGRVVADGSPAELLTASAEIRFDAASGLDVSALAARLAATVVEERPGEYRVDAAPEPSTVAALTAWFAERQIAIGTLRAGRRRLEDLFLELVSDEGEHRP